MKYIYLLVIIIVVHLGRLPPKMNGKKSLTRRFTMDKISCPKCNSTDLYRYGKEKHTGLQKYLCKHCKTQFVPNRPYKHKSNTNNFGNCPLCGSKLHLRKRNKNSIQLRCSKRPNCRYTVSIPLNSPPLQTTPDVKIPKFFRFPLHIISYALSLYFLYRLSSRQIKEKIQLKFSLSVSHTTIISWCKIFSSLIHNLFNSNLTTPKNPPSVWLIDETVIKVNGKKLFIFAILDYHSRYLITLNISPTKDLNQAKQTLLKALEFTKAYPKTIISDRAACLAIAIEQTFAGKVVHQKVHLYSKNPAKSNNRIERFFSTFKQNFKNRRNPRSIQNAILFSYTYAFLYNFKRVHSHLNSTPAQCLGVEINAYNPYMEVFLKCLI